MRAVSGLLSPLRRVAPHVLGPRMPAPASLWAAHGRRALSAAFCVAVPLAVFVLLDRPDVGAAAALGGFTAVYGHALPYRRRAAVSAGVGVALAVAVGLGGLAGPHPFLLAVMLGVLGAAATAATAIWQIGPPGPLMAVLVGGSASALGAAPGEVGQHVAATAGTAALSWLVVLVAWCWDPAGPERRAVAAADQAVSGAEDGRLPGGRPDAAARAVRTAHVAVAGGSRRRPSLRPRLEELDTRFLRALPATDPTARTGPRATAAPARRHTPLWVPTASRIGVGAWAAGTLAAALGLHSPYWASTAAVAVLLGTDARHSRARALHRVTGTLLGTGITALLFALDLPVAVTVALIAVMLVGVELLVVSQYVLAVALITPVSLSLVHLGADSPPGADLITIRLGETVVGIAVGLAAGLLLFPRPGSRRLPAAVGATVERALAAAAAPPGGPADAALRDALVAQHEVATAARAELFAAPGADRELHRSRQVADLGWALLGARARGGDALAAWAGARITADLGPR
ncbi:FUSC family protein [Modestobacter altitudinis]|uniref:FUSC family protein n=1 Tax=Modestobacter altitudinis TaxID=2213158 RepID=UPI00110CF45C|nr:FUSC family protein [Modestobacter altitudinis]